MFGRTIFIALAGLLASQAQAQHYWRGGEIFTCKSSGYQQNYCEADTRDGVVMRRQISNSACIEGRTWGFDHRGVWVTQGCEAEFQIASRRMPPPQEYPPGQGYGGRTFVCRSTGYQQEFCAIDTRGGVRLRRQLSSSSCVRGRSWGIDRGGIWVSDGCQGEFAVGGGWDPGYQPLPPSMFYPASVVRCESRGATMRCDTNTRGGVRLQEQLSNARCVEGRSWGWDNRGIWVSGGCRADFKVGGYYR